MSVQIHCDNCDESLGVHAPDMLGRGYLNVPEGALQATVRSSDTFQASDQTCFCDWLCLAKWAKRKASDE